MANRFFNPDQQFCDSTGLPYAGGSLAFYASGTSTPLNTYSDSALTIANTNPVVLDSAGRSGSIFLQNLAYKVVLSDVNNVQIWTEDPVYASDYSTRAKLTSGAGSPNGVVAGTAGSAGIGADTYWDNVNNILYVCTQTGNAATAVWTAINSASAAAIFPAPQGYLTPTSGTPIIITGYGAGETNSAATSLVYTPYVGNVVPIYTGTGFNPTVFSELTLTLTSSQAANTIYDVFVFNNAGALTLVTGPAWSNSTAGSCARGTGAGTTQLSRLSGIWVNAVAITGRNSSNTYSIPASQATYLGSIFIDNAAGQLTLNRNYGQSRKWAIWNAYNRVPIVLQSGDSTANWTTAPTSWRQSNASSGNYAMAFSGLAEEIFTSVFQQDVLQTFLAGGGSAKANIAIGVNSTTTPSGFWGFQASALTLAGIAGTFETNLVANNILVPSLGINQINMIEQAPTGSTSNTFFGASGFMNHNLTWRG